jgi:hypothetical protein
MPLIIDGVSVPIEASADAAGFAKAKKAIDEVRAAEAAMTQKQKQDAADSKKIIADISKQKQDAAKAEQKAIDDARKAEEKAEQAKQKAIQQTTQALTRQREQMERLSMIGRSMAVAGAAIWGAAGLAAKNFVDNASEADRVANKWRDSTERISEAQLRLGREVADILNPEYSKLADTLENVMSALGRNPQVLSSVLQMGGTLLAGGTAVAGLASIAKQLSGLALMTGNAGLGQAAGAIGKVSEIALYATTVVLAAEAGLAIGNSIQKALGLGSGQESWSDVLQTFLDLPPAMLVIFQNGLNAIMAKLGIKASLNIPIVRAVVPGAQANTAPVRSGGLSPDERGEANTKPDTAAIAAAAAETARREALTHDRNMKLIDAQKKLASDQAAIQDKMLTETQNFLASEAQAQTAYYNSRTDMIRAENIQDQRAEEDHQKKIQQIHRDAADQELQLAQSRDALGLVRAKRDEERKRSDEESSYRTEVKRRNQDLAEKLRVMDRDFALQRQYRLREYNLKMQTYQAEVQAAQTAYQAIINAIYQLRQAAAIAPGAPGNAASRAYAGVGTADYGGSASSSNTTTVTINGGALSMTQVRQQVDQAAKTAAVKAVGAAIAV